jgi:hypothetical protein
VNGHANGLSALIVTCNMTQATLRLPECVSNQHRDMVWGLWLRATGGLSSAPVSFNWTVVAAAPAVQILTAPDAESSGTRTPFFSLQAAPGASGWRGLHCNLHNVHVSC